MNAEGPEDRELGNHGAGRREAGPETGGRSGEKRLSALCRRVLREPVEHLGAAPPELAAHAEACAMCRDRLALRARLVAGLRSRPEMPRSVASTPFMDAVQERIVESIESSPHGRWLDAGMPQVSMPAAGGDSSSLPVLDSESVRRLVVPPPSPPPIAWANLRRTLRHEVAAHGTRVRLRRWSAGLAAAAAATIVCALLVAEGTSAPTEIVFVELDEVPIVDLAALRSGIPR
jgi:hypothetical protein